MTPAVRFSPLLAVFLGIALSGCATTMPPPTPTQLRVPEPRLDTQGRYLSPYTTDGTVAPWVAKGRSAALGAGVGGFLGREAGERALSSIPFVGGWLGNKAGASAGRAIAIRMVGGEEYMRETSDQSFDTPDDLIVYLFARHSEHPDYEQVRKLTLQIYPDLEERWVDALRKART